MNRSIRTAATASLPGLVLLAALAAAHPAAAQPPADPAKKPEPAAAVDEAQKPVEIFVFMGSSIDSFAAADLRNPNPKAKPFFQMCIDSDFGGGPDNIQTFFGLDVNVLEIFK